MRLTTAGLPIGFEQSVVGRVACEPVASEQRGVHIFVSPLESLDRFEELRGYRATITPSPQSLAEKAYVESGTPIIYSVREYDHFRVGDLVLLQPTTGFVRTVYRPDSQHNTLFVTERCNSNCLMCSQPPKDRDDVDQFVRTNLEVIGLIHPGPQYIGITGGEPTLLGQGLMSIISALRDEWPATDVHMLTNGRMFAWSAFTRRFASVGHSRLTLGIPLYSDDPIQHDYIVQAKHAFDQTVIGLHALARWRQQIEIRVVLHRQSIPRLPSLARYIYRNFPFVGHVALMGLEPTGYTPRNREKLWIDPFDYQDVLEEAVEILSVRGMNVSLYNLQLCLLRPSLWKFARKSISDWKNIYLPECEACGRLQDCGGLFKSSEKMHSAHIHSLPSGANPSDQFRQVPDSANDLCI